MDWSNTGNGNPLQCSCLENPRDGGAWWAAVYGVAQSQTWLMWLSSSSSSNTGGEGHDRWWDGWMALPTQWRCVWINSRSWWWTGRPGMLQSMGVTKSQTGLSDWTELKKPKWGIYCLQNSLCTVPFFFFFGFRRGQMQQLIVHLRRAISTCTTPRDS